MIAFTEYTLLRTATDGKRLTSRCLVRRQLTPVLSALAILVSFYVDAIPTDNIIFDSGALKAHGLDPALATQFQLSNAFPPGVNTVTLHVNGISQGKRNVRFDLKGEFCPDAGLLRQAGLKIPASMLDDDKDNTAYPVCADLKKTWPQFTVVAHPADGVLELVVPQEALAPEFDASKWQHGGIAALLNYNTQFMNSDSSTSHFRYWQVQSEGGFNAGGWVVRSNQSLSYFGDNAELDHQNAYLQRTFPHLKSTLRAGQVPLTGGLFGIGQVVGFQMTPEQGLYPKSGVAVVTGIADGPSVVEIRQLGVLIYHTTVPVGPFSLSGFSLLNARTDLSVTLKDSNGGQRSFIVPASAYARGGSIVTPGLSWGVGRYDQRGANQHPMLGMLSQGVQIADRTALQSGVLWSADYQALSASLNNTLLFQTSVSLQSTLARTSKQPRQGMLTSLSLSQPLGERLSLTLTGTHQDKGYREFSETLWRDDAQYARNKNQYGAGLAWSDEWLGSVSLSIGRSTQTLGSATTWSQLGWGRQFGKATLSVNASRNDSSGDYTRRDDRIYASLRFPLGDRTTVSSTLSHSRGENRYGSRIDQRLSQDRNWSLSVEQDAARERKSVTGTFSAVTRWSNLAGSMTVDSERARSLSLQASGSLVAHGKSITSAPYAVRDTFGIARVGKKNGVRLETSGGPVWTDSKGFAVIPSFNGWTTSRVDIDTRSLGDRTDVVNGTQEVSPARGSVSQIRFDTVSSRRVLVRMKSASAPQLPKGTAVYDAEGTFITIVDDNGNLFLPDAYPGMTVSVDSRPSACTITLDKLPKEQEESAGLYETIDGICQ